MTAEVTEPAIQTLIHAINEGDRSGFFAALTPDATMSDDGRDRDLTQAQLADSVGCSVIMVRKLEGDQRRPSRDLAARLLSRGAIKPARGEVAGNRRWTRPPGISRTSP